MYTLSQRLDPRGGKADRAENEAKVRRELLYENWKDHFDNMSEERKKLYEPPASYDFPTENSNAFVLGAVSAPNEEGIPPCMA